MSAPTTWADGRGVWHVRVSRHAASPLIAARRAIRDEIAQREDIAQVDRSVWMRPVRLPEFDTPSPGLTVTTDGRRVCRTCARERDRAYKARKRMAREAGEPLNVLDMP